MFKFIYSSKWYFKYILNFVRTKIFNIIESMADLRNRYKKILQEFVWNHKSKKISLVYDNS